MVRDRARAGVLACAAAAALALVGCPEDQGRVGGRGDDLTAGQVLGVARAINMGEIDQATAVQGRVADPNVSAMIERIIQDHRAALQQLDQVGVQMGLVAEESELSRELTSDAQQTTGELVEKQGEDLTKDFIDAQVEQHEKALSTIDDKLLPATTDPALQQYLNDLRGTIAAHLEMAKQMKDAGAGQQQWQGGEQGHEAVPGEGQQGPPPQDGYDQQQPQQNGYQEPSGVGR